MNPFNLADVFVASARAYDNRTALISGKRVLTFGQLAALSAQTAHALAARGIEPGQNVGLALRDGADIVVHLVALWMINATGVVIDFRSPAPERVTLADEFDLVAIITNETPATLPYAAILTNGQWQEDVARQPAIPPAVVNAGHTAVISLTSGTTGRPLGLLVSHEDTLKRIAQNPYRNFAAHATHMVTQPLHFAAARNNTIQRLVQGWTVIVHPPLFSVEELAEEIIRRAPESTMVVPTVIAGLLDYARNREAPLFPSLKQLNGGGAMTPPQQKRDARALLSPNYIEIYASSLCSNISMLTGTDIDTHADTVGRVGPMVRLEIVDEDDTPLPFGRPGSIRVRTPSMVGGTYKDRTRPQGDRLKDGWVYPGDIGVLDEAGFLRIVGRASDVIIRGGANVHPSEIERVLSAVPGVAGVAVVGYASEREGEEIAAFVVADATVTEASLTIAARTLLSPDKRPRRIVLLEAFPHTSVGKLDRKALRAMLVP